MTNRKILLLVLSLGLLASCKKDFLEDKRDLTGVNEEVFEDPTLATAYVDYIYGLFLPPGNSQANVWSLATNNNNFTQTSEELPGETNWNKPWATVSYLNAHALPYFGTRVTSSIGNNTWTRMKQINIFLNEVDKHGLPDDVKNPLKGQLYFWRAFQFFDLVRLYGGVPLVLTPQDPIEGSGSELEVPRSSSTATFNQIISDLDMAISLLPGKWDASSWGRITSGGAAALKGRVLLTWASPLFNRNDDASRWQAAYDANLAAKTLLEANGFGLYKKGDLANATAWANMFLEEANNPEAVISFGFNSIVSDQTQKWNGWEQAARPRGILGAGSISPTRQTIEAFPMKDGKMPGMSAYAYDTTKFYKNRDPRFYKTFAYNGALWPYSNNTNYRVWTYRWYANAADANPTRTTEQVGTNASGVYVRKYSNTSASNTIGNFSTSGTDFIELRFAEVVLNLAEAAIGVNKLDEAKELIKSIRERAGVENLDGSFGLGDVTSRDGMFAAVLGERQVEFAYENKRFWDLRRWMLFNDDFGTCSRLGIAPLNGTRRTGYYIGVKTATGEKYVGANNEDPLYRPQYTASSNKFIAEREPEVFPPGINNEDEYVDYLYDNYFKVTVKDDLDPTANNWVFSWYDPYYFFGLNSTILTSSPYLEQTKGWDGLNGEGSFDPLQ